MVKGLEERFASIRGDVSRELAKLQRETKEHWAVASKRLAALEAHPNAELQLLRTERQEEWLLLREP